LVLRGIGVVAETGLLREPPPERPRATAIARAMAEDLMIKRSLVGFYLPLASTTGRRPPAFPQSP
jgi:hypothetical protein